MMGKADSLPLSFSEKKLQFEGAQSNGAPECLSTSLVQAPVCASMTSSIPEDESDTIPLLFGTAGGDPVRDNPRKATKDGMPFSSLLRPNKGVEA
jgi:hypothetical protein